MPPLEIIYDGDCPFCSRYVQLVRLRESVGTVRLIDARSNDPAVADVQALGYDLNEGMIARLGDQIHYGDDCLHFLALMSTRSGAFNSLNGFLFSNRRVSSLAYPILRSCRNLTLRVLGRSKIGAKPV